MSRTKKSYSFDFGSPNNRSIQPKNVKFYAQRSVMHTDAEVGRRAEIFVKNEHRQKMREIFDSVRHYFRRRKKNQRHQQKFGKLIMNLAFSFYFSWISTIWV